MKQKLTVRTVEGVLPGAKDVICMDSEVPGFGLKVTPKGRRSFFLYYRTVDHTQRRPFIGTFPTMRPEQARSIAKEWLAEVRRGGDPSADRQLRRATRGQGRVVDLFEEYKSDRSHLRSMKEIVRVFEQDILPTLGNRKAEEVTRSDVTRLLDRLSSRSTIVASNARKRLSAFYSWALPRLPDGAVNPVIGSATPAAPSARERVLSDIELSGLWGVLEKEAEPWSTALKLLVLTGQRRSEVFEADWSEFDLEKAVWAIPAGRTKNGKLHIVPLSPPCVELLKNYRPCGSLGLSTNMAARLAKLIQRRAVEFEPAAWSEFDLSNGVWRLPKKRAADKRDSNIKLPSEAVKILTEHQRSGRLFPGSTHRSFSRAAQRIRGKLDLALETQSAPWSWHDIRRTVATGLQRLGVRLEVTEAVLNHVSGTRSGIVGVYQRYDWLEEKRDALALWAGHISALPKKTASAAQPS